MKSINFDVLRNNYLVQVLRNTCDKEKDCRKASRNLGELGETSGGSILVRQAVIVGPYKSDNFTTITDAIAAAPNNTRPENGYFVIYAREGVYEEYIVIPIKKKNLMLIGDGINKTIITGNHNVVDGWTTYNSSSFGWSFYLQLFSFPLLFNNLFLIETS